MGASEVSVPMLPSPLTSPAGLQVEENGRNLLGRHLARVSPVTPVKLGCGLLITVLAAAVLGLSVALSVRKREEVIKSPVYGTCPENWIVFGSKCFYFSEDTRNWAESQAFCKELGAELVQFENLEELNVLMRYKGPSAHWIGLSRESSGQPWKWMDGTEYNNIEDNSGSNAGITEIYRPCVFRMDVQGGELYGYLSSDRISSSRDGPPRKRICSRPISYNLHCPQTSASS